MSASIWKAVSAGTRRTTLRHSVLKDVVNRNLHVCNVARDNVSYTSRSATCGTLTDADIGKTVKLCGWVQYWRMGGLFFVLRDWQGLTQVVVPEDQVGLLTEVAKLSYEAVVEVSGQVCPRLEGQENKTMSTGKIEVKLEEIKILNPATTQLPFNIGKSHSVKESLRMEHRYLDLRTEKMQRNLRLRSKMIMKMREFLCNENGFVDVETPTLFRRTPGGAKEFVVPSHIPGKFYSLPQSPQQFKQLLMVGGLDRYFQIARCYRDEGSKPDRQPEFTQLDLEMSFIKQEGVIKIVEDLLKFSWPEVKGELTNPFPRMTYEQAMRLYGIDKPDTRFDMKLVDVTKEWQKGNTLPDFVSSSSNVVAIVIPEASKQFSIKELEHIQLDAKKLMAARNQAVKLLAVKISEDGTWKSSIAKQLSSEVMSSISSLTGASPGDLLFMAIGDNYNPNECLGRVRLQCADLLEVKGNKVKADGFNFLWVTDFPMFLPKEEGDGLESTHHPFTDVHPEDVDLLMSQPHLARSQHYDLVLNGSEVGGGSIRIHSAERQRYVLEEVLKEDSTELEHLLTAFSTGCPPHGGIALGLDRLVAIVCGADSIRDVIAFPKSQDGKDPMSKAPAVVSQSQLDSYHIQVKPSKDSQK